MKDERYTKVEFAGQTVRVPHGGYYDRFRANPDLNEVARDPEAGNIDWFRRMPKQQVSSRVGQVWAPNFYYRSSVIQLLMAAPLSRLRPILPEPLEPLRIGPWHGLVALSFFSYRVCDNDPYAEASVAVVVPRPGAHRGGLAELLRQVRRRSFYAHVLALPVTTDIARVRGIYGYQLPKWIADISLDITADLRACVKDASGAPDLSVQAPTPPLHDVPSQSRMGCSTMLHQIDGRWHRTVVQSNTLSFAQRRYPRDVTLTRHGGPLSALLNGIGASRVLQLDVMRDAQMVLNMPAPLDISEPLW
ncbi:acetoacetate decarboxylase [Serratia marcescens]|uniref:acetoacetate decarboxylase family protein n=1 Tax=Serratia marcescens TaxID=615 RepID=UPI00148BDA7C|nr:acetoacetate decarboxylase family protein [Serratia marcescens]QJU40854.1 acetoacetate decarboxylase [Serratia marcescens]BEM58775.1 acetoacetate decarboxylase [Serratia marcescens]BEO43205.1 acetoacetate decarboxylase [Serratia marcescens]